MKLSDFVEAMRSIEDDRKISIEIVENALDEALNKALKKHLDNNEANVEIVLDKEADLLKMFQVFEVVLEVDDENTQISLEKAKEVNPEIKLGDTFRVKHDIKDFGRPAALLAKNVLKQQIREAEKQSVYDEYIDQLYEMVTVAVETVEDRFLFVNLGRAYAIMPLSAQIPGEHYYEGQKLKVVITEVNKESKGAQIIVSRADDHFVRRLFEMEVPEIYQGLVEIKAIARDAGDRTKIAVYSKDENIDPIGACIGPRGSRVQVVIEELAGEKIDIFEWSDDIDQLIKSSLAPAEVLYVLPTENERSVIVVVDDSQLSLAIGRGGKNAKLAVKLLNKKIDIKPMSEILESGIDYKNLSLENKNIKVEPEVEKEVVEVAVEKAVEPTEKAEVKDTISTTASKTVSAREIFATSKPKKEKVEKKEETVVKKTVRKPKEVYVSKFEKLADPTVALEKLAAQEERAARRNRRFEDKKKDETKDIELDYELEIEYTEEELAEIERMQELDESSWIEDDIDFEDFEDYYED